ncbi:class I SAM-dependent methyltransferase, partial [Methanoculleus sp. 7T]|uniref:class I SAM-dependent methyltransferase n=1 Tax=Methanoculleus sp. 7T TaxID=2937282 RepID=UPI0020C0E521
MDIGAIDWNAVWAEELRQNHAVVGFRTGTALWSDRGRAVRYDTQVSGRRVEETLSALPLVRAARVLDIGAGPGTLALPLARRVRTVTAVEPASGMADVLEDHIDEEGIGNISVVRTRWEDVDP